MDKKIIRVLIRQSETREALNKLMSVAEPDEKQQAEMVELRDKGQAIEVELRDALKAELDAGAGNGADPNDGGERTPADPLFRELRERVGGVASYVKACVAGTRIDGAALELNQHLGIPEDQVPVELVFPSLTPEERAAATVAAGAIAENPMPTAGEVFISALAGMLGIRTPSVAPGVAAFPYVSTGAAPEGVAAGVAVSDSSPAISALTANPKALSATLTFRREQQAQLADLDNTLTTNIREALRDEFDDQICAGSNTGDDLNGLLVQRAPATPGDNTLTTFETLAASVAGFVDGKFAEGFDQVRTVMSPTVATYLQSVLLPAGSGSQMTLLDWLRSHFTGGLRISGRVPTVAAVDHGTAGNRRAGGGGIFAVRTRVPSLAYAPVWRAMQLVRDESSAAVVKKREVVVTAFLLAGGVAIVRPDAYTAAMVKTVQGVNA